MRSRYNARCACNCGRCQRFPQIDIMPSNPLLANAYVPFQEADELFCPIDSLENGTTFPELVSPYNKNDSQETINYLRQARTCERGDMNGL